MKQKSGGIWKDPGTPSRVYGRANAHWLQRPNVDDARRAARGKSIEKIRNMAVGPTVLRVQKRDLL